MTKYVDISLMSEEGIGLEQMVARDMMQDHDLCVVSNLYVEDWWIGKGIDNSTTD